VNDRSYYPPESRGPETEARHRRDALLADPPIPSHEGFCGPEAGCDGACMDLAYWSRALSDTRRAIRRHP
jgi:hypothetical protein